MLETAPAPGILKVSATAGPRVSRPDPPAPRDGQLRHTQASQGASLAQRTSSFSPHFVPTSSSWLNLVERWFGELTSKRVRRGSFSSVKDLQKAIGEFLAAWNENPKPFVWTATVESIQQKLAHCRQTLEQIQPGCTQPRKRKPKNPCPLEEEPANVGSAVDAVLLPAELPDRDSLLRQREDRAGRGDAAQYVLAKRDQRRCGLGSDRA